MFVDLHGLVKSITDTLLHNNNQFASGGILLMALGSIGALFRKVPEKIWDWIVRQTTVTLTLTDDQDGFFWMVRWLSINKIAQRSRLLDVVTRGHGYYLAVAPGSHWFWYRHRPVRVTFTRSDDKTQGTYSRSKRYHFQTIGRNRVFYDKMMEDVVADNAKRHSGKPRLYCWMRDGWTQVEDYEPRPWASVILPADQKQRIVADIENFHANKDWYREMGIPYHRGYIFYGPPGTGKTSTVIGLSSLFLANVYILKLNELSDQSFLYAISNTLPNSMIVMEDADCLGQALARSPSEAKGKTDVTAAPPSGNGQSQPSNTVAKTVTENKQGGLEAIFGVTLSGLLNVIDGIQTPSGIKFFLTTNHIEKLDPALLRPGRVDVREYMGAAEAEQKQQFYSRFFPGQTCPEEILEKPMTMAELQELLMQQRNATGVNLTVISCEDYKPALLAMEEEEV